MSQAEHDDTRASAREQGTASRGVILHALARYYDLFAWASLHGRERAFRERLVNLARLRPGDAVLDVGCGTGSVAIVARQRVGAEGYVFGIDPSPEMLARARRKAARARLDIAFQTALVQELPFADARFDVVLSTLMMHHLPRMARDAGVREIRRVLKPGGRLLVVDFGKSSRQQRGLVARMHRHGRVEFADMVGLVGAAQLTIIDSGEVGTMDLHYVLATVPAPREP